LQIQQKACLKDSPITVFIKYRSFTGKFHMSTDCNEVRGPSGGAWRVRRTAWGGAGTSSSSRGLRWGETYLTETPMVLRAFKRLGASVRGGSQEQPLAAPWVAGTLRARSGASLHESLLATVFLPVASAFSFFRPACLVHGSGASLHDSLSATELVASATYVVPFLFFRPACLMHGCQSTYFVFFCKNRC